VIKRNSQAMENKIRYAKIKDIRRSQAKPVTQKNEGYWLKIFIRKI